MAEDTIGDPKDESATKDAAAPKDPVDQTGDGTEEVVSKKELDRVVQESIKRKEELNALKKLKADADKEIESYKTKGLKDKEKWKELAELHENKAKEYETKYTGLQTALVNNTKMSALVAECAKLGMIPEAQADIGTDWLDLIEIETTSTGRYSVINAKTVAESIKMKKPYFFGRPGAPNVNTNTPGVNTPGGSLTAAQVMQLNQKAMKTKSPEDVKAYHDATRAFAKQTNGRH